MRKDYVHDIVNIVVKLQKRKTVLKGSIPWMSCKLSCIPIHYLL